jgi:hypothetical protein
MGPGIIRGALISVLSSTKRGGFALESHRSSPFKYKKGVFALESRCSSHGRVSHVSIGGSGENLYLCDVHESRTTTSAVRQFRESAMKDGERIRRIE